MFKFSMDPIAIDTSAIQKAGATVRSAAKSGEKLVCTGRLSSYKIKTVGGAKLTETEVVEASSVAQEMHKKGWLSAEDKQWCFDNGITVK